jgi:transketolase
MKRPKRQVDTARLAEKAKLIRRETVRLTDICGSGHYGSAFSMAEMVAVLYYELLHLRPDEPGWADRDRFLLGKGHAAIGLYPVLADLGFFPASDLDSYTRLGSPLGDHPDMRKVKGVVCLMGDGEQAEGQVWEAAMAAAHFGLTNLVGIVDNNKVGSDGVTQETMRSEPLEEKWRAFGWEVLRLRDGHDLDQVRPVLDDALNGGHDRPVLVLADTVAGRGVSFMEHTWQWHLGFLGPADRDRAVAEIERGPA